MVFHCSRRRWCWLFNTRMRKPIFILVCGWLFIAIFTFSLLSLPSTKSINRSNSKNCSYFRKFVGTSANGPTKFPLVIPHVEPNISCEDRKLFIAVFVNSASADEQHLLRRMAIRKTWGASSEIQPRWRVFFALGISKNTAVDLKIRREALKYNDILIGNFTDTYKNVVIKTFMSHYWAYFRLNCEYILKADDDVYIRVPRLVEWLAGPAELPTRFYGGYLHEILTVVRDPRLQWYLPKEVYNETNFPPFSQGSFQVVSTDMLPSYFHYTQFIRKPFHTDDAYFGVMARDLGLSARQIPGFRFSLPKTDEELLAVIAFGHQVEVTGMLKYYLRYELLAIIPPVYQME
ncbi:beta-1,3-galactosyltransferase 1-like [Actinia tenebrosa]|uniref:Hexosyltransferase n=1 Tax=Actinia tenebrosa TaxID=6105 RepID=A0A6P8I748_ACTTE|nr:beta-1,3-galactosyltransferase 1-like [Actinia tenebrosa]